MRLLWQTLWPTSTIWPTMYSDGRTITGIQTAFSFSKKEDRLFHTADGSSSVPYYNNPSLSGGRWSGKQRLAQTLLWYGQILQVTNWCSRRPTYGYSESPGVAESSTPVVVKVNACKNSIPDEAARPSHFDLAVVLNTLISSGPWILPGGLALPI